MKTHAKLVKENKKLRKDLAELIYIVRVAKKNGIYPYHEKVA